MVSETKRPFLETEQRGSPSPRSTDTHSLSAMTPPVSQPASSGALSSHAAAACCSAMDCRGAFTSMMSISMSPLLTKPRGWLKRGSTSVWRPAVQQQQCQKQTLSCNRTEHRDETAQGGILPQEMGV